MQQPIKLWYTVADRMLNDLMIIHFCRAHLMYATPLTKYRTPPISTIVFSGKAVTTGGFWQTLIRSYISGSCGSLYMATGASQAAPVLPFMMVKLS